MTFDLDYLTGLQQSDKWEDQVAIQRLNDLVNVWAAQNVGLLGLHIDRGFYDANLPAIIQAMAESLEKRKAALKASRQIALAELAILKNPPSPFLRRLS